MKTNKIDYGFMIHANSGTPLLRQGGQYLSLSFVNRVTVFGLCEGDGGGYGGLLCFLQI